MELLPVVCLCLLTRSGITSADGNDPAIVIVEQDRDAVLPCSLSTKENIELKLFDWKKAAQKDEKQKEVFFYDAGITYNNGRSGQSEQFKGRVSHFPDELKHGNASIIIRNTKMADSGDYTCVFPRLDQTFHIKLVVDGVLKDRSGENIQGAAPKPVVTTRKTQHGVLLQCEVPGSPQPTVELKDSAGNILPAGETLVSERGGRMYFTVNTTVTRSGDFRCVATQETLSHQIYTEIYVSVNGPTDLSVYEGDAVTLPCSLSTKENIESKMFEWKKDDQQEVFLYDAGKHYNNGNPGQSEQFKGRVFHFPDNLKHGDASITIRNTKIIDSGNYTCDFPHLQPRYIFHINLVVESGSGADSSGSPTGLIVGIVVPLFIILIAVIIMLCIKLKCNKGMI